MQINNVRIVHSRTQMHTEICLRNSKQKTGLTADGGNRPLTKMAINILLKLM